MTTIDNNALQANPQLFFARVEAGETLRIARDQRVVAELKPVELQLPTAQSLYDEIHRPRSAEELNAPDRPYGLCKGEFEVSDDFDDLLPEDILRDFEGS